MKYSKLARGIVLAAAMTVGCNTTAVAIDGTSNVLCASLDVVACMEGATCMQGRASDFDVPKFLVVDVKKKVVRAHRASGIKAESPIRNIDKTDQQYILQGVEEHRGWTISINRADGTMATTSSGSDVNIMMFGNCTAI